MKNSKKRLKALAYFLTALMLLQSCTVYRRTPVNLEQAEEQKLKVKVETRANETYKFKYISYEDGQFYGVKKKAGEWIRTPLNQEDILKILIKNKSASTWLTVAVIVVPIGLFAALIISAMSQFSVDWGGGI